MYLLSDSKQNKSNCLYFAYTSLFHFLFPYIRVALQEEVNVALWNGVCLSLSFFCPWVCSFFLIMSEQKIEMGSRREAICYTLKAWRVSDLSLLCVLGQIKPWPQESLTDSKRTAARQRCIRQKEAQGLRSVSVSSHKTIELTCAQSVSLCCYVVEVFSILLENTASIRLYLIYFFYLFLDVRWQKFCLTVTISTNPFILCKFKISSFKLLFAEGLPVSLSYNRIVLWPLPLKFLFF